MSGARTVIGAQEMQKNRRNKGGNGGGGGGGGGDSTKPSEGVEEIDAQVVEKKFDSWKTNLVAASYFHIIAASHLRTVCVAVWGAALVCAAVLAGLQVCDMATTERGNKETSQCGTEGLRSGFAVAYFVIVLTGLLLYFFGRYTIPRAYDHVMQAQMLMTLANVVDTWQYSEDFWADLLFKIETEIAEQDPSLPQYIVWRHRGYFKVGVL